MKITSEQLKNLKPGEEVLLTSSVAVGPVNAGAHGHEGQATVCPTWHLTDVGIAPDARAIDGGKLLKVANVDWYHPIPSPEWDYVPCEFLGEVIWIPAKCLQVEWGWCDPFEVLTSPHEHRWTTVGALCPQWYGR